MEGRALSKILSAIILLGAVLFSTLSFSSAPSLFDNLLIYDKKVVNHRSDLIDLAKNVNSDECEKALSFLSIAEKYSIIIDFIRDFSLIKDLIHNQPDKSRINFIINNRFDFIIKDIDLSIKEVNLGIAHTKNQGIITVATDLRNDLRMIKEILLKEIKH